MTIWGSRVCGIGDEAAPGLAEQLDIHLGLGLRGIELRTVSGRGLHELDTAELADAADRITAAGLTVPVLDTPIGNWSTTVATDFGGELDVLARSAAAAAALGCRRLRVMSYPNDGRPEADWAAESMRRMRLLAAEADRLDVVLLHENCQGWAGASAANTLRMLDEIASEHLRLIYDVGNGLAYNYDADEFLAAVLPFVEHVHLKDGHRNAAGEATFTFPGEGGIDLAGCVRVLEDAGYRGWYSLEPHVAHIPHLGVGADPVALGASYREYADRARPLFAGPSPAPSGPSPAPSGPSPAPSGPSPAPSGPSPAPPGPQPWGAAELVWLVELMAVPSVSPLEGGDPAETARAMDVFAAGAVDRGFTVRFRGSPPAEVLEGPHVPVPVREAYAADPHNFLAGQPSVVLAMGDPQPPERRIVVNVHLDTVGPHVPPSVDGAVLRGRGAVDDKGPGVAAAAGIAAAFARDPGLAERVEVLLVAVPGEEGGAMGVYGTRWLVESGYVGRLMLFAEPTGGTVLDACTAAMTPRLTVDGMGSTDDHPGDGHNATVALGFVADHLSRTVGPRAHAVGATLCVAGLHTGTGHNRVYGTGELRLNIAYRDAESASVLAALVEDAVADARTAFAVAHAGNPFTARLIEDWEKVVRLDWLKRGLPVLDNRDAELETVLAGAGFPRRDGLTDGTAFTCDAIWATAPGRYVVVCGPGWLDHNGAHTDTEHVAVADLATYARQIAELVTIFGAPASAPPPALT